MPSDAARQSSQPARIEIPDQLQQSRRAPTSQPGGSASHAKEPARAGGEASPPRQGILGQLETERAHD